MKKDVVVSMDDEFYEEIRVLARKEGLSISEWILQCVQERLEQEAEYEAASSMF